jgi:hypothetical protein
MMQDLLEQLAQPAVPPVPPTLEARVHRRVNHLLAVGHFVDLLLRGLPFAGFYLVKAVWALVRLSLPGHGAKFPVEKRGPNTETTEM